MANNTIQLKRSSVAGKQPNTSTLAVGELALNLTDQKIYSSNGTGIFEPAANVSTLYVGNSSVALTANNTKITIPTVTTIVANGTVGTSGQVLTTNGTGVYWSTASGGSGGGIVSQQQYTGDGSTTSFTFTGGYTSNTLAVYLNGVLLRNGTEANVQSGSTFTISPAPANGALIDAIGFSGIYANGVSTVVSQQFTANGTANSFTVTGGYVPNQVLVFVNGVKQIPGTDVAITSGNTVNLAVTPANGFIIDVYGAQSVVGLSANTLTVGNTVIGVNQISVGNSTVNTQIVAGNVFLNGSTLIVGNTSTNTTITGTNATFGSNTLTIGTAAYHVANGNLGIGTSTPAGLLDVNGTIYTSNTIAIRKTTFGYSSAYVAIQVGGNNAVTSLGVDINGITGGGFAGAGQVVIPANGILFPNAANTDFVGAIARDSSNRILIGPSTSGGITSGNMVITSAGNVGIGTTSPAGLLDVANRGITKGSMPVGSVVQFAQGTKSTQVIYTSVTSGTEYDPQMSVSITPSSTTSKILILVNMQVWFQGGSGTWYGHFRIYKGATLIYDGGNAELVNGASVTEYGGVWTQIWVDTPGVTTSTTYSVKWVHDGGGTMSNLYFHRNNNPDSITVMEIAQ